MCVSKVTPLLLRLAMHPPSIIRITGATLVCLGSGGLVLVWLGAKQLLHMSGKGPGEFVEFAFLGRPISWMDLHFHDTYYLIVNPVWSWLALFACVAGAVMAVRPDWLSRNRGGRE
jgi:hypothetical protein